MQPELHGMLPVADGEFAELQRSAVWWPTSLKLCAAVCNSLNLVNKFAVVGDAADFAAFKACEATFLVRATAPVHHYSATVQLLSQSTYCVLQVTLQSGATVSCVFWDSASVG